MLIETIKANRIQAMKDKDSISKNLLSTVIGSLENKAKTDKSEITDSMVIRVCKKFIHANNEVIADADWERADILRRENIILMSFLPKQLTEDEIRKIVIDLKANDIDINMGQAMKYFKVFYDGRVDNKLVSHIVKEII